MEPVAPQLKHIMRLSIQVGKPESIDDCPEGNRKLIPILGGTFCGEGLNGKILPGGADSLTIRRNDCAEVNARYCLKTDDGAVLYLQDRGFRHGPKDIMQKLSRGEPVDPAEYYFRTCMRIETGAEKYTWLNKLLIVGSSARLKNEVVVDLYQVN